MIDSLWTQSLQQSIIHHEDDVKRATLKKIRKSTVRIKKTIMTGDNGQDAAKFGGNEIQDEPNFIECDEEEDLDRISNGTADMFVEENGNRVSKSVRDKSKKYS